VGRDTAEAEVEAKAEAETGGDGGRESLLLWHAWMGNVDATKTAPMRA